MIDERLASIAREVLSRIAGEQWDQVRSEIQDNGTFMLLMVRIPYGQPPEVPVELKRKTIAALEALIPEHTEQTEGSWQVNVYLGTALVDSIFSSEK